MVKRSPGKWDLERGSLSETIAREAGSQMKPGRQALNVTVHSFDPVPILMPHN